ncbi:hypothetical protein K456DRAFT_43929 [Colletotrichum gloeosporioides 23]|nr:hypothetical protein K456DRAFT_43929 [Colletotrichum gloeosporioides 23]
MKTQIALSLLGGYNFEGRHIREATIATTVLHHQLSTQVSSKHLFIMKPHILRQKVARLNNGKKKALKTKQRLQVNQKEARQVDLEVPEEQIALSERPEAEGPEIQTSWPKLSTWNKNHIRNMRESRLLQIPEELLVNIMRKAPPHELFMLRQTCFTFFRLFQDVAFKAAHVVREIQGRDVVCFNLDYQFPGLYSRWLSLLRPRVMRLNLCQGCYSVKTKQPELALWRESRDYERRLRYLEGREYLHDDCDNCRRRYPPLQFSDKYGKCILHHQGEIGLCRHRSVLMRDVEHRWKSLRSAEHHTKLMFVKCEECVKLCHAAIPAAASGHKPTIPPSISTFSSTCSFTIEWNLPIFPLGEQPVTETFLLDQLSDFGERHGRRLLCPHFEFRRLLECFDPRICSCLGMDIRVGGSSMRASSRPGITGAPIPTCSEASRLTPGANFIPASCGAGMEQHSVSCDYCTASYGWGRDDRVVFLRRWALAHWDIRTAQHMEGVIRLIDPCSYVEKLASKSRNILWCPNIKCRNGRDWVSMTKRLEAGTIPREWWMR